MVYWLAGRGSEGDDLKEKGRNYVLFGEASIHCGSARKQGKPRGVGMSKLSATDA